MTAYYLEAALKYARVGVAVFPCDPKNKKPLGPQAPSEAPAHRGPQIKWKS
jgi:hypothetical protein